MGWITEPIREYHVELWFAPESDGMWASGEYRLSDAADVHEAIAWAEAKAAGEGAMYALYAVVDARGEGRVWLAGVNPTSARGNFDRKHP